MNDSPRTVLLRLGKLLLLVGATLYAVICLAMALSQRSFIYHPTVLTSDEVDAKARDAGLQRWTNSAGAAIGFKRASSTRPAAGSVLVFYGNADSATRSAHYADDMQRIAPMDVYILEYPGYEDRPGVPTEKSFFHAAEDGFEMLPTNKPIYVLGESLGSGVACYLAGCHPDRIAGLILISPYDRLTSVAHFEYPWLPVGLLMVDRFPSADYLRRYHGNIGVSVDGRDAVIPEKIGLRLYHGYAGPKKLWEFPDGGHCQIRGPQSMFWKEAFDFLDSR